MLLLTSMRNPERLNVAIWCILLEIRVSIVFPFLLWLSRRIRSAFLLICFVLLSFLFPGANGFKGAFTTLSAVSGLFILGILLHKHLLQISDWYSHRKVSETVVLFCVLLFCFEASGPISEAIHILPLPLMNTIGDYSVGFGAVGIQVYAMHDKRFRSLLQMPSD